MSSEIHVHNIIQDFLSDYFSPPRSSVNFNEVSIGLYLTVKLKDPFEGLVSNIAEHVVKTFHYPLEFKDFPLELRGENYRITQELCKILGKSNLGKSRRQIIM